MKLQNNEALSDKQKQLDHNNDGKIDSTDLHKVRKHGAKTVEEDAESLDEFAIGTKVHHPFLGVKGGEVVKPEENGFNHDKGVKSHESNIHVKASNGKIYKFAAHSVKPVPDDKEVEKMKPLSRNSLRKESIEVVLASCIENHKNVEESSKEISLVSFSDYSKLFEAVTKSTEQLDELSKTTLGSYIKKASDSGMKDSGNAGAYASKSSIAARDGDFKKSDDAAKRFFKYDNSMNKRKEGIVKAVNRLTRESSDIEFDTDDSDKLDEISKDTIRSYKHKAEMSVPEDDREYKNRSAGIERAEKRLKNESVNENIFGGAAQNWLTKGDSSMKSSYGEKRGRGNPGTERGEYKIDVKKRQDPAYKDELSKKVMAAKADGFAARNDFKTAMNNAIKAHQIASAGNTGTIIYKHGDQHHISDIADVSGNAHETVYKTMSGHSVPVGDVVSTDEADWKKYRDKKSS